MDWRTATIDTIGRLRGVFDLDPSLTRQDKLALIKQARLLTKAMSGPTAQSATDFWGKFTNTLRTLVAAQADNTPRRMETIFNSSLDEDE